MKNFNKKTGKTPFHTISIVYCLQTRLFTDKFSRTTTIHPGIFRGRALWADSVSPRKKTIASRDQFKPGRIGEYVVVYYNDLKKHEWNLREREMVWEHFPQASVSIAFSISPNFHETAFQKRGGHVFYSF